MTSEEFLSQIRTPAVLGELKHLLGLPDTVEALHQVEETLALRREVGALSETIGLDVEAIVATDLPDWLERHHQIQVQLQCPFFLSELGDEELDGLALHWR